MWGTWKKTLVDWRRQQENCSVNSIYKCCTTPRQSPQLLRQTIKLNSKQWHQRWREAWHCLILHSNHRQKGKDVPHKAPKRTEEVFSLPQELSTWLPTPVKESQPQSHHSRTTPPMNNIYEVRAKQDSEKATGTKQVVIWYTEKGD